MASRKVRLTLDTHPTHVICADFISDKAKEEAIIRLAEWVIQNGIDADGSYRAGRDLLLRMSPRTKGSLFFIRFRAGARDSVGSEIG